MLRRFRIPAAMFAAAIILCAGLAIADRLEDTDYIPLDHPAIKYMETDPADPVGLLDVKIDKGTAKLDFAPNGLGYLPSLLKQLNINIDSQVLVFSHTSIQAARISPRTPRAIYFNDDVSVGFVQNGEVLEFTALDPIRGIRMYVMSASRAAKPSIGQREDCRQCHQGAITMGVPGLVISSIHPASASTREMHGSAFITDQNTPFKDRWGGWYVTGTSGSQVHLGNNTELIDPVRPGNASPEGTQNVTSLADKFDTSRYLAPTSDLIALMTLEHQVRMTNLLIRIGWDARIAIHDKKVDAEREKLNTEIEEMVRYMLFTEEDQLKEPVAGVSTFSKTFPQRGPKDSKGRSLRDFDLQTRLFRYPLSYMIYSAAFDNLPDLVKDRVYRRLFDLLTGDVKTSKGELGHLTAADRGNIVDILRETKKGLPAYWAANARQ